MKFNFYILPIFFICIASCKQKVAEVEQVQMDVTIINDSLYTSLPGDIVLTYPYLTWCSVFSTDTFLYIVDIESGEEIGKMGRIGRGPKEFVSPAITKGYSNQILVYDANLLKQAYYSIDSLFLQRESYTPLPQLPIDGLCSRLLQLQPDYFIALTPDHKFPFALIMNQEILEYFGKFPIHEEVTNGFEVFQGNLTYNESQGYLLYSCMLFPYVALYEKDPDNHFHLKWEKTFSFDPSVKDHKLVLNKQRELGFRCIAMTKDYIVAAKIEPDQSLAPTTGVRNLADVSRRIYVYDYDLNLKKVVDLNMQVLNMVSDSKSNTLYFIGISGSYCLAKCEL